jgi:hypothetical protein
MACVYAVKGDKSQALRYLRIALLNGYVQLETLSLDPDLAKLQGDPQFERLKRGDTDVDAAVPPPTKTEPGTQPSPSTGNIDRPPGQ